MVEQNKKFGKYAAMKLAFTKECDDNIGSGCWKIFQKDWLSTKLANIYYKIL